MSVPGIASGCGGRSTWGVGQKARQLIRRAEPRSGARCCVSSERRRVRAQAESTAEWNSPAAVDV
eukprot:1064211-Rhodomonas_salina.1